MYQIRFPKTVETITLVNELSRSLHTILHPRAHKFCSCISVYVRSHTVTKIFLPRAFVDVIIRVIINTETVFRVVFPFPYRLTFLYNFYL